MISTRLAVPALVAVLAAPLSAWSQQPTDTVYACADISEDVERLACYDQAVGRLKQAEEAGEITTVTREQVEEARRDSFGFSMPSFPSLALSRMDGGDAEELEEVTYQVVELEEDRHGKLFVTLENGQVWQQTDNRT